MAALSTAVLRVPRKDHPLEATLFACQAFGKPLKHLPKCGLARLCRQAGDDRLAVIALQRCPGKGDMRICDVQERR